MLPVSLSSTYPMVNFVTSPRSLKVTECACTGESTILKVAGRPSTSPSFEPVYLMLYHTRLGSNGQTRQSAPPPGANAG